jgi:hypothetical protein
MQGTNQRSDIRPVVSTGVAKQIFAVTPFRVSTIGNFDVFMSVHAGTNIKPFSIADSS